MGKQYKKGASHLAYKIVKKIMILGKISAIF
jgi:hypothetical protein